MSRDIHDEEVALFLKQIDDLVYEAKYTEDSRLTNKLSNLVVSAMTTGLLIGIDLQIKSSSTTSQSLSILQVVYNIKKKFGII